MAAGNQQAKKVAWLESMLDTSIVAYESHRNALENIYAQLAQWQHPPNTGCIHISPEEVQELLRDINDVLDQCALQLQPFHADAATPPPQEQPREDVAVAEPDSRASSRRDVSHTPSIRSPTQDHPLQPEQQQQQPPPPASSAAQSNAASKTPSTYGKDDRKPASVRTVSDAPSRATHASAAKEQQPPQQHHPQQPRNGEHARTASATPSQASSVPPSTTYNAEAPATPPAEAPSDRHSVHSHPRQRAADSQAPSEHSVRSSVPPPRGKAEERAAQRPRQPADTTTTAKAPTQGGPAQAAEAPRPRMQTCHHHRRVAGLALTPWPILNEGKDDAAAVGGHRTPSATARAEATKEELPAEQYNAYKEHGVPRATSMERRATAAALERRAKAVEEAKENAVYLPPDDQVAERAAAAVRARQPAPTSSPSESQRSQPQPPQQQQARPMGSSARAGPASTAPSSVGGASQKQHEPRQQRQPYQQQSHSQCEQSLSAAGEEGDVDGSGANDAIPRRRGPSAASESASDAGSSASPAFSDDDGGNNNNNHNSEPPQRSASQHSRRSQPPQQQQQQQQQLQPAPSHHSLLMGGSRTPSQLGSVAPSSANAQHNKNGAPSTPHQQHEQQPRTVTSSRASSAVGPRSASAGPQQQQQQQQQPSSAAPPVQRQLNTDAAAAHPAQMEASQVGSVGLVYTPSVTPQRDSTREGAPAAAAATQRPPQQQQPQQRQEEPYQSVPGAHRPLRTAVPRRTTPRAYDSTQSEDAIFHGRLRNSPHRPPVRADSPHSLRYMEREDAQLKQRREEELAEIQQDPRQAQQLQQIAGQNGGVLKITDGSAPAGVGAGAVAAKGKGQQPRMTALEEQLIAERAALHNQLEKMQMEVTIATGRNKEWGNERRYSQVNTRMTRVLEDLDRVEKELRTVRNLDREARLGSAAQAR